MNKQDRITAIKIEMKDIGKDMAGINPKLSLYKELQEKQDKLNIKINEIRNE